MTDEQIKKLRVQVNKLQIRVDCLTAELEHQKYPQVTSFTSITEIDRALLSPGDQIWILNTVKRPKNWNAAKPWNHLEAKRATVTLCHVRQDLFHNHQRHIHLALHHCEPVSFNNRYRN
jgi:hypothetical protein